MSLRQKYTWNEFKREQGDKAKDLKRTSAEGKKAFEAARKAKIKDYVKTRVSQTKKDVESAEKKIQTLKTSLKGMQPGTRKSAVLRQIAQRQRSVRSFNKTLAADEAREV